MRALRRVAMPSAGGAILYGCTALAQTCCRTPWCGSVTDHVRGADSAALSARQHGAV